MVRPVAAAHSRTGCAVSFQLPPVENKIPSLICQSSKRPAMTQKYCHEGAWAGSERRQRESGVRGVGSRAAIIPLHSAFGQKLYPRGIWQRFFVCAWAFCTPSDGGRTWHLASVRGRPPMSPSTRGEFRLIPSTWHARRNSQQCPFLFAFDAPCCLTEFPHYPPPTPTCGAPCSLFTRTF